MTESIKLLPVRCVKFDRVLFLEENHCVCNKKHSQVAVGTGTIQRPIFCNKHLYNLEITLDSTYRGRNTMRLSSFHKIPLEKTILT